MQILDEYNIKRQEIFDYFGYVEDWVVIPLDDSTMYYWRLNQEEDGSGFVEYDEIDPLIGNDFFEFDYQDEIYTQRFLSKWVYHGKEYTMICCNPGVDGNKFLRIFDNSKQR